MDHGSTFAPPDGFQRLRLLLAWDGASFAGWQSQRRAPSVQDALHAALVQLGGQQVARPVAAGRTDAGVHAEAMPAHVDVPQDFRVPPAQLARALNAHLPPSVAVLEVAPAPPGFHARFSCTERRYTYRLLNAPQRHPLWAGRALHVPGPLDVPAMNAAAATLLGTHDFAAFATREDRQTVRELRALGIQPGPALPGGRVWEVHVAGESFLRHMVRGLVGTLLLVGRGKLDAEAVSAILAGRERSGAGANVPAHGLYFTGARYDAPARTMKRSSTGLASDIP
ncbi:tRNA pseudouridine(38-40) synthase TruA [Deinococcus sp. YIM 77859]|uniref:tRNA pseudouridine(38-40) synthase TruA n=1 Tax=Deinococcus sp. YIM 77859 TaxID=1540221 RepID=UPI00068DC256|nr:tRNA pseudouridine(38-40) synthase TruA [Deinococcus sp. YIM 77859]